MSGQTPLTPGGAGAGGLGSNLSFRTPARPGSSLRKARQSTSESNQGTPSTPGLANYPHPPLPSSPSPLAFQGLAMAHPSHPPGMGFPSTEDNGPSGVGSSSSLATLLAADDADTTNGAVNLAGDTTARQYDRRARNAAPRDSRPDQALVNSIQFGLIAQIRALHAKETANEAEIAALKAQMEEAQKEAAMWKPKAVQLMENEEAFKQENWDLSVAKQTLEEELSESQAILRKAEAEKTRLNREITKAREMLDSQRVEIETHTAELERIKSLRETEAALARKERAGLQRDNSNLQTELQHLRADGQRTGVSTSKVGVGLGQSGSQSFSSSMDGDDTSQIGDISIPVPPHALKEEANAQTDVVQDQVISQANDVTEEADTQTDVLEEEVSSQSSDSQSFSSNMDGDDTSQIGDISIPVPPHALREEANTQTDVAQDQVIPQASAVTEEANTQTDVLKEEVSTQTDVLKEHVSTQTDSSEEERIKRLHESELALARTEHANVQRDYSNLQTELQQLRAASQLARAAAVAEVAAGSRDVARMEEAEKEAALWKPKALQSMQNEEAFKQENSELSVAKQMLEEQLSEAQAKLQTADAEKTRLNQEITTARETLNSQRVQIETHTAELERIKSLRESDEAKAREMLDSHRARIETHTAELERIQSLRETEELAKARETLTSQQAEIETHTAELERIQSLRETEENKARETLNSQRAEIETHTAELERIKSLRETEELTKARETLSSQRAEIESHVAELERIKGLRETEASLAKEELANLQRDYTSLQAELQQLRADSQRADAAMAGAAAGGLVLVGAHSGPNRPTRNRESNATFGGGNSEDVDKSKPPHMQVPPPPPMPPPAGLSARRSQPSPVLAGVPPRPTSPPPAELVSRVREQQQRSSTLQVPNTSGRPSLSGMFTSNDAATTVRNGPAAGSNIQREPSLPSMRARTYSTESKAKPRNATNGDHLSAHSRRSRRGKVARKSSQTSFASDVTSELSHRISFGSSDAPNDRPDSRMQGGAGAHQRAATGSGSGPDGTNPDIIQAITQTMIGEYLFKYTRRTMRAGYSDKRHKRFFWVHPYTRMLYWTMADPGGARVSDGSSKGACIEDIRVVEDSNPNPPGLFHLSIIVKTAAREMKLTAPNKERHDVWLAALGYLVNRGMPTGDGTSMGDGDNMTDHESRGAATDTASPRKPRDRSATTGTGGSRSRFLSPARSLRSRKSNDAFLSAGSETNEATPRPRNGSHGAAVSSLNRSLTKRAGLPAREYLEQVESDQTARRAMLPPRSQLRPRAEARQQPNAATTPAKMSIGSAFGIPGSSGVKTSPTKALPTDDSWDRLADLSSHSFNDPRLKTAEEMLEEDNEGFDGIDNVRACCDGMHDVGSLAHKHHHHQHQRSHRASTERRSSIGSQSRSFLQTGTQGRPSDVGSARSVSPAPQVGNLNLAPSFSR
ncbi:unnamed protein product [Tilletia laevis]|uniref:PH domain-containing protein n=5 Tax=Tilletia TaxID=13289 RepID=A0A9N8QBR0_9BASI|nr:hypothetical protein A4X03_0g3452 [Tilletia caries]CAD6924119.1 unnamed protein product [Tilletia laevis]